MVEAIEATSVIAAVPVDDDENDKAQAPVPETEIETAQRDDEAMSKISASAIDITTKNNEHDDHDGGDSTSMNSIHNDHLHNLPTECPSNKASISKSIGRSHQSDTTPKTTYSPNLNYKHLLQLYSQHATNDANCVNNNNNNNNKDVQLCTLLQSISHHIHNRTHQLASSLSRLESKLQHVDYNVNRVILLDSLYADFQSVLVKNTDDDDDDDKKKNYFSSTNVSSSESKNNNEDVIADEERSNKTKISDKSHNGLEKLQREEDEAIQQGFMALSIFHDHTAPSESPAPATKTNMQHQNSNNYNVSNPYFEEEDLEEDDDDSFYYYESSSGDIFNQRPLPFIIGSMEFWGSVDGGIGGEVVSEED
jgi:hypothetical protein